MHADDPQPSETASSPEDDFGDPSNSDPGPIETVSAKLSQRELGHLGVVVWPDLPEDDR